METSINEKFAVGSLDTTKDTRRHASVSNASTADRVMIEINDSNDSSDTHDVFVQVNGRAYTIRRGVEVGVPPEVVHALEHAVIDKAITQYDASGLPSGLTLRPTRRYPFRFTTPEAQQIYQRWSKQSLDLRDAQIEEQAAA